MLLLLTVHMTELLCGNITNTSLWIIGLSNERLTDFEMAETGNTPNVLAAIDYRRVE